MRGKTRGFSLLELAVIVLVLGLLTTLTWRFIAARLQQKDVVATRSLLERADWALTGFILSNHRLPCPATDVSGFENCTSTPEVGRLPYKTLGMADARAARMRYGVLRRDDVTVDPEVVSTDPSPPPARTANLAQNVDRFYPLVAYIGAFNATSLPTLTTATPLASRTITPVRADNIPLNNLNGIDFCQALRVSEDPVPDNTMIGSHIHTTVGAQPRQLAYALALPGALDSDDDSNLFDGSQTSLLAFDPPQQGQTNLNNDRVRAVTPGVLWNRLGCGEAVSSIGHAQPNAATAAVMLYVALYDYEQVLEQAVALADASVTIATSGILSGVGAIIDAVAGGLHAAADAAKTFGASAAVGIPAAVLMATAAATIVPTAIIAMVTAVEAREMAKKRYKFLQSLRASAQVFAQDLTGHVPLADGKGLYLGRY